MKVIHINTHDTGGAAVASYRLHQSLTKNGVDSSYLVLYNSNANADILTFKAKPFHFFLKKVYRKLSRPYRNQPKPHPSIEIFTSPDTVYDILTDENVQRADIIHLHWVANFLDYESFFKRVKKPVVWTFHDKNPIRGGFHYDIDQTFASSELKMQDKFFEALKLLALQKNSCQVISPSAWLKEETEKSRFGNVFNSVQQISYGLEPAAFPLMDKKNAKQRLGLDPDKCWILIIAANLQVYRKGFDMLEEIIYKLIDVNFILVGKFENVKAYDNVKYMGVITEPELLSYVYNAADAVILSSREDNLPNVMIEALMSGTPVIGFPVGGIKETILTGINGFLSKTVTAADLIETIQQFKNHKERFDRKEIRKMAIDNFNAFRQADAVTHLYRDVINRTT